MMLIDTHCHLDVAEFDADRLQVLEAARRAGVGAIVIPGIHAAGWPFLLRLCAEHRDLYPALGMHPVYLQRHRAAHLDELQSAIRTRRPLALGEIGLDYFVHDLDKAAQLSLFEAQLELAAAARLPVILHVRKAHDQVLACLRRVRPPGGIAHAFSGSIQQAHHYIDLGFGLGFGGMLTFERSRRLRTLARDLPLDALVLETDAPDLTVASHRGERNSPAYLPECLQALAEVRGADPRELARSTTHNACRLLGLPAPARGASGGV